MLVLRCGPRLTLSDSWISLKSRDGARDFCYLILGKLARDGLEILADLDTYLPAIIYLILGYLTKPRGGRYLILEYLTRNSEIRLGLFSYPDLPLKPLPRKKEVGLGTRTGSGILLGSGYIARSRLSDSASKTTLSQYTIGQGSIEYIHIIISLHI